MQGRKAPCETFVPLGLARTRKPEDASTENEPILLRQKGVADMAQGFDAWSVRDVFEVLLVVSQICLASNPPNRIGVSTKHFGAVFRCASTTKPKLTVGGQHPLFYGMDKDVCPTIARADYPGLVRHKLFVVNRETVQQASPYQC